MSFCQAFGIMLDENKDATLRDFRERCEAMRFISSDWSPYLQASGVGYLPAQVVNLPLIAAEFPLIGN